MVITFYQYYALGFGKHFSILVAFKITGHNAQIIYMTSNWTSGLSG